MPKVRILSGSQAGAVVDLPVAEAESAIATGFAAVHVAPSAPASQKVEKKARIAEEQSE